MAEIKLKELQDDILQLNLFLKQAQSERLKDILSNQIKELEREIVQIKDKEKSAVAAHASSTTVSNTTKRYQIKLNGYGWDQSDKFVKIFVTLKDVQKVPKEQVYCTFNEKSVQLHVENLDNKDYMLVINKLLEPINITESHWKQKTDMVVIFLAKSSPKTKWSHMTEIDKKIEDQRNNRFKPDDFDKKDPQESIMGLMKNMYETGDDEMKKMISKAWYEGQNKKKTDTVDL